MKVPVQSFPTGGSKQQVSTGGGAQPRWRRSGELYYLGPDRVLMAVATAGNSPIQFSRPAPLLPDTDWRCGRTARTIFHDPDTTRQSTVCDSC